MLFLGTISTFSNPIWSSTSTDLLAACACTCAEVRVVSLASDSHLVLEEK
jgi:hypothetical protein